MKHTIDLHNYNLRTDIALDELENIGVKKSQRVRRSKYKNIIVEEIIINLNDSKIINKKPGNYTTISFNDITDETNRENVKKALIKELTKYLNNINKEDLVLVVGLGNNSSTPDSLGPSIIDNIIVTNHLYNMNVCSNKYQKICAIAPSVTGKTGIETFDQIKCIVDMLEPKLILIIDSLATSSIKRLNKTIQITDTGINPGSGIGNDRKEISFNTLGVPVIALGVPTVVNVISLINEILSCLKYSKKDIKKQLNIIKESLIVTPNNIDYIIDILSKLIGSCLNIIFSS